MDIILTVLLNLIILLAWLGAAFGVYKLLLSVQQASTQGNSTSTVVDSGYRRLGYIAWLAAPAWITLVIELIGGWRFAKDTFGSSFAIPLGSLRDPVVLATMLMVILSPVLVVAAIMVTAQARASTQRWVTRSLLTLLAITLLISMFSCLWSCSGHATWTSGYKH